MKYIDEFRDKKLILSAAEKIKAIMPKGRVNIMEVCGTHTQSFFRFGLDKILPNNLRLIAGPGCPVCVSHQGYIDQAITMAQNKNNIIVTFGDMLRVPGTRSTLEKERAAGSGVRTAYSPLDSLTIAKMNPDKKVVFLSVGFETTAPTIALSMILARKNKIKNLFFFTSLKLIPPALDFLAGDPRLNIRGFLCPGHVSAIIGTRAYGFIAQKYGISCCVAGFEPLDILEGLYLLLAQIKNNKARVDNQYSRVVNNNGNPKARAVIKKVFQCVDAEWRGLGRIPDSGLAIRGTYSRLDARKIFAMPSYVRPAGANRCRCGDILKGLITPKDCPLFSKRCHPDHAVGPCMVSQEGACNAYYRFRK